MHVMCALTILLAGTRSSLVGSPVLWLVLQYDVRFLRYRYFSMYQLSSYSSTVSVSKHATTAQAIREIVMKEKRPISSTGYISRRAS
jgi:hypothetical protein